MSHFQLPIWNIHRRCQNTIGYLGSSTASQNFAWMRAGSYDFLAKKDDITAYFSDCVAASRIGAISPPLPSPATLSAIIHISEDKFLLVPWGLVNKPVAEALSIGDLKLSCSGKAPKHPLLAAEFSVVLENLRKLMGEEDDTRPRNPHGVQDLRNDQISFHHKVYPATEDYNTRALTEGDACITLLRTTL